MHEQDFDEEILQENPDLLPEYTQSNHEHPTPEELLFRMAIEKALSAHQRKVWEWYNYDRLTTVEIAQKLKINQSSASRQIKTIERKLAKWCKSHQEVYVLLKQNEKDSL